jgi:hypothetical protein
MQQRVWRIAAAMLAASSLSGCAVALIPVLAGGALATSAETDRDDDASAADAARTAQVDVVLPGTSEPSPPAPAPAPAPVIAAAPPPPPPPAPPPPAAGSAPLATAPLAMLQLTSFDPAFAQLSAFALGAVAAPAGGEPPLSAVLADPVELDGRRRPCLAEQAPVVVVDLDPAGGTFAAPASVPALPEHAAALARMRAAGITIAWISRSAIIQTGAIRSALDTAGLDPRGQDVLMLASSPQDRKQSLLEALAGSACILAIAGDERTDFDERFRYLRDPAAGVELENLIGEGPWFLIRNIIPSNPSTGTPAP